METNINYMHSVIDEDTLDFNGEKLNFYVIDYYEGIKEEANLDKNILLLWNNYNKTHETWFEIKASDTNYLMKYLSNEIGILTLMEYSDVHILKRYYSNYGLLTEPKKIDLGDESIQFPEDNVFIGQNLLKIIDNNINYESILNIKKKSTTLLTKTSNISKVVSSSSVNYTLLGAIAA